MIVRLFIILLILFLTGCSEKTVTKYIIIEPEEDTVYISVDIDDIFIPNWDYENNKMGDVKIEEEDVYEMIRLTNEINARFDSDFKFTLGYNSGYYDSTNAGDNAIIDNAGYFRWFNHFPRHELVILRNMKDNDVRDLLVAGNYFAAKKGFLKYIGHYLVTPQCQGIWPPYEPLYNNFKKYDINYVSTTEITKPAMYDGVFIMPRFFSGLSSNDYSYNRKSAERIRKIAYDCYDKIMSEKILIINFHQANFAKDRLANECIRDIEELLDNQKTYKVKFLTTEKLAELYSQKF